MSSGVPASNLVTYFQSWITEGHLNLLQKMQYMLEKLLCMVDGHEETDFWMQKMAIFWSFFKVPLIKKLPRVKKLFGNIFAKASYCPKYSNIGTPEDILFTNLGAATWFRIFKIDLSYIEGRNHLTTHYLARKRDLKL